MPEIFSDRFRAYREPVFRLINKSGLPGTSFVSPSGLFGQIANESNPKEKGLQFFLQAV